MGLKISSQPKKYGLEMSHLDKSDVTTMNWRKQLAWLTAVTSFHLVECICLSLLFARYEEPTRLEM